MALTGAKCLILDDEELEKTGKIRVWREEKRTLEASRIFGGPTVRPIGTQGPSQFPSAFRNPKRDYANAVVAGKAPEKREYPKRTAPPVEGQGALFQSVRGILGLQGAPPKDTWRAIPEEIAAKGIPLFPLDDLNADDEGCYAYAACTPPPETTSTESK